VEHRTRPCNQGRNAVMTVVATMVEWVVVALQPLVPGVLVAVEEGVAVEEVVAAAE
jgi:hypothetical protein